MNRRTSHYRLTVSLPGADRDVREEAISDLIAALPTGLHCAGSCYTPNTVEVSYRATDDLQATSIAQDLLRNGFADHEAWISTGYGAHRRVVAEQVTR